MSLEKQFCLIREELKSIIINRPGVSVPDLNEHFGWSAEHSKIFMRRLRRTHGINGNKLFLFETKFYFNPDTRQYYNLCFELGYAIKHKKEKTLKPYDITDEQRLERRREMATSRKEAAVKAESVAGDRSLLNGLWPGRKESTP